MKEVFEQKLNQLQSIIDNSDNIVFFGGAGVSTESGIPDFRSQDGLYAARYAYPPETILSHTFFFAHTKEFFDFYREKMLYLDAKPNAAHIYLAKLEAKGKLKAVITQNIDNLHQAAGSVNVCELHGSVYRNYCIRCGKGYSVDFIKSGASIPLCSCGGVIKPDVVLYEEGLDKDVWNKAFDYVSRCDTLIVGGTSLTVYPAAYLTQLFCGQNLVLINKNPTLLDKKATLCFSESIGKVLGSLQVE